ncbi:MAG: cysteine desulfurase family protein [Myxococcota bacterium]
MIYLDNNATAPVDTRVREACMPYLTHRFGNPSSGHIKGHEAKTAIIKAKEQVASAIGAAVDEVVFTSGGSESNNFVLKGLFLGPDHFCKGHLVVSAFEHAAVLKPAQYLAQLGVDLSVVPCQPSGRVDPNVVADAIRPDTRLVSVMHANNEIGTLQPIDEIAAICQTKGVLLHSDASQSVGKTDVNVNALGVDFLTIAGHKVYAPKGVGALYMRRDTYLHPLIQGVGHENGHRAGTENVAYQVALGCAMNLVQQEGFKHWEKMAVLRDLLWRLLKTGIGDGLTQNGATVERLPNTLSVNFPYVTGVGLLAACPEVCASTSAACHSGQFNQTVTQKAIGLSPEVAAGTVRFSLGWHTTQSEIEQAAAYLIRAWHLNRDTN